jgi:asparagine synthase (glutamine-hydrolysing)
MCGIAGWVAFDHDLTTERAAIDAMTDTMARRGPDGQGTWIDRHAAFGHRRLSIIDPAGGEQPMTAQDCAGREAVVTHCGEVYNYRELRSELAASGHVFRTSSDTEVILRAYLEWGEQAADRFTGIYGLAIWDRRSQELLLIRDRFGVKPLYYHRTPDGVLFGSEAKAILASSQLNPVVDTDGMREMFSFVKTPERSVYRDIREVRPGHIVRVSRDGLSQHCYWRLEAAKHRDDLPTTIATVRRLLFEAVVRELVSDVPVAALLSGGLDSSALAAVTARELGRQAETVRTFAVDFTSQTEDFQFIDGMRPSPDTPFARIAASFLQARHTEVILTPAQIADPSLRAAWLRAHEMPTALADQYVWLYLLVAAIKPEASVVLTGSSADELFGGYPWSHDPEAVDAEAFPWLALARYPLTSQHRLLHPDLRRLLDLKTYRADSYRTALSEVPHVPGASLAERRMRENCYLNLTRFQQILLDRKDRLGMAHGLEFRVPFCDHALAQYVFNTPWSMKTFDGREKSLLRAALRGMLPEEILQRVKCPSPTIQHPGYELELRSQLRDVMADPASPTAGLIDTTRVEEVLATPPGRLSGQQNRMQMEMIVNLHVWLTHERIALDLCA